MIFVFFCLFVCSFVLLCLVGFGSFYNTVECWYSSINDMMAALQNQHMPGSHGCLLAHLLGFSQMPLRFDGAALRFWSVYVTRMVSVVLKRSFCQR